MESRKIVLMNLFAGQQWRCRHREQTYGHGRVGRKERVGLTERVAWKQPRHSLTHEWLKMLRYICTTENYSAIKRNTFESVLVGWMNLERIIYSEVS